MTDRCSAASSTGIIRCALLRGHWEAHFAVLNGSVHSWVGEASPAPRPSRDAYFLSGAEWASARAECRRLKVGALIVDADGHVRGHGYNGALPGLPSCLDGACPRGLKSYEEKAHATDYSDCIADHAERNAIRNTDPRHVAGSTLYVSCRPCPPCWTLIRSVGIARVVWPDGEETL